jgi:hypothetical protein
MSAGETAQRHFKAALADAVKEGVDPDAVARATLSLVISTFLEKRSVADVRSELLSAADNVDPDTDYMFMRP